MQYSESTTTADSQSEGRLKVDAGMCPHGKRGKCLKCAIKKSKKDGQGGPGYFSPPGYGAPKSYSKLKEVAKNPSLRKKVKSFKFSSIKSKGKKMSFGKAVNSKQSGSLKKFIKAMKVPAVKKKKIN